MDFDVNKLTVFMFANLNWDTLAQDCEGHPELSEAEQRQTKAAFIYLKETLGPRIFHVDSDFRHPLRNIYLNNAAWRKKWSVWLAAALQKLEHDAEFNRFVAALKKPDKYRERMAVLEFADMLSGPELTIKLEPKVEIAGVVKQPDLMVSTSSPNQSFYMEVSDSMMSDSSKASSGTFEPIVFQLMRHLPWLHYSGRVERVLTGDELCKTLAELQELVELATRENHFVHFVVPGAVDIGLAPMERSEELARWSAERGLEPRSLSGPPVLLDEAHRLRLKIKQEQKQLPKRHSNVIAINSDPMFAGIVGPRRFHDLRRALQEELCRFPHIELLLIACGWMGAFQELEMCEGGCYSFNRQIADMLGTNILVIPNNACANPWHPETRRRFIDAIRRRCTQNEF